MRGGAGRGMTTQDKEFFVDTENRPVFSGKSIFTIKLIDELKGGKPGDTRTDEELTSVCGRDTSVKGKGYASLCSAIRHCRKNYGVTWERINRGNAIRCLNAEETVGSVSRDRSTVHRRAKVAIQKLGNAAAIAEATMKPQIHLISAQMGALASFSSTAATKRLEARADKVSEPELGKLLEAMMK